MSSGATTEKEEDRQLFEYILKESQLSDVGAELNSVFAQLKDAVMTSDCSIESLAKIAKLGQYTMCLAHTAQWKATQEARLNKG